MNCNSTIPIFALISSVLVPLLLRRAWRLFNVLVAQVSGASLAPFRATCTAAFIYLYYSFFSSFFALLSVISTTTGTVDSGHWTLDRQYSCLLSAVGQNYIA